MNNFFRRFVALSALCLLLAACGSDTSANGSSADGASGDAASLPTPTTPGGSITGMPNPRLGNANPTADANIEQAETLPDPTAGPGPGLDDSANATENEPGADAAVRVIRDYYAAINLRNHAAAYALWRGQGLASGVSAEQFAQDFDSVSGVSVTIGQPGAVDPGAGQRRIDIPVTLVIRNTDGSEQRYRGQYVLQRTIVDGASEDQRAWRIASAQLSAAP